MDETKIAEVQNIAKSIELAIEAGDDEWLLNFLSVNSLREPERKTYEFKFYIEDITREQAEYLHDELVKSEPFLQILPDDLTGPEPVLMHFLGMNECEIDDDLLEDSDGPEDEKLS